MTQTINVNQLPAFIAVVEFLQNNSGKQYDFFSNIHVKHGDTVVVDTVHGLQLATVVGVKAKSGKAGKWVVDKVNVEGYYKRREMEEKAKKLKREMEARAKQLSDIQRYQQLASIDPEMARMLDEYKQAENQLSGLAWDGGTINLNGIK